MENKMNMNQTSAHPNWTEIIGDIAGDRDVRSGRPHRMSTIISNDCRRNGILLEDYTMGYGIYIRVNGHQMSISDDRDEDEDDPMFGHCDIIRQIYISPKGQTVKVYVRTEDNRPEWFLILIDGQPPVAFYPDELHVKWIFTVNEHLRPAKVILPMLPADAAPYTFYSKLMRIVLSDLQLWKMFTPPVEEPRQTVIRIDHPDR